MRSGYRVTVWLLLVFVACFGLVTSVCATADLSPDKATDCYYRFNLEQANIVSNQINAPTVVDFNESTQNILVRGPLPLEIRKGSGNDITKSPCMNLSDWRFGYDELNTILQKQLASNTASPGYFTDTKKAALSSGTRDFNLSDYDIIVISMIDNGIADNDSLNIEIRDFGGNYTHCSGDLVPGTIHNSTGTLIWWPVGFWDCFTLDKTGRQVIPDANVSNLSNFCDCTPPATINCPNCDPKKDPKNILVADDPNGKYCSYVTLIDRMTTMMGSTSPSGKKRLIYYHCVLGSDRTGGVTIGYLLNNFPKMKYYQAYNYARSTSSLGKTPNPGSSRLADAYCVLVRGGTGDCSPTSFGFMEMPLLANFDADKVSGTSPLAVTFADKSTGPPTSWSWNFGDGTSSSERNPSHTYRSPGVYTVTLTATSYDPIRAVFRSNTMKKTGMVTVTAPVRETPKAKFSAAPTTGTAPLSVRLTDGSTGNPTMSIWNFGDGTSASGPVQVHVYKKPGNYTVTLSVMKPDSASGSILRNSSEMKNLVIVTGK